MRITVAGWGNVGRTLGNAWRRAGHEVSIATREPESDRAAGWRADDWVVGRLVDLAVDADAVVLAMPGSAMVESVTGAGEALAGRLVIDTTNHLGQDGTLHRLGELTAVLPQARIVRAFTTMAWENFENPTLDGRRLDQYYVADPGEDAAIAGLIRDIGLTPVHLGGLADVEALDAITKVWFHLVWRLGYPRRTALTIAGTPPG
jgi:8-hydroxy-5-deazaflavin:NADPH oxidoreductase